MPGRRVALPTRPIEGPKQDAVVDGGLVDARIASTLSQSTVKKNLASTTDKPGVATRVQAVTPGRPHEG